MNVIFHIYPRRWCSDCRLSCDVPSAAVSPSSKQQSNPLRWKHIKDSRAKGDSGSPRFPCRVCVRGISSSLKHNIIKCFMCLQKMHRRLLSTMAYFDFAVKGEGEKNTPIPSGRLFRLWHDTKQKYKDQLIKMKHRNIRNSVFCIGVRREFNSNNVAVWTKRRTYLWFLEAKRSSQLCRVSYSSFLFKVPLFFSHFDSYQANFVTLDLATQSASSLMRQKYLYLTDLLQDLASKTGV